MDIIGGTFRQWTEGLDERQARINIYEHIRDIPYAAVPELNSYQRFGDILRLRKGSCLPKHLLLCTMYQMLGLMVLYVVYPFRWDGLGLDYPPEVEKRAAGLPAGNHLACKVEIEDRLVLVDATADPALEKLGIPVNKTWDGLSDTLLPIETSEDGVVYHPTEANLLQTSYTEDTLQFYRSLNRWLEEIRAGE